MPKKALVKLQYIKAIQVSADRGKVKNCQLCQKEFSIFTKEHQCKRCKRAVCEACSPHKAVVQKYEDQKGHRQCNFCKLESDQLRKFIDDNKIEFLKDTMSIQWMQVFDLDIDTANKDYKQASDEVPKAKDDKEAKLMASQITAINQEMEDWINYSLREFFTCVLLDQKQVRSIIQRVLTTFLCKFPEVGWSPDLVVMVQFFLCFASESVAYMLLTIVYGSILPSYLYNRSLRTKPHEYVIEIEMIMQFVDKGLRMQTPEANALKYLLQATLQKYMPCLTVNFLLFETTFFVINQMFRGGNAEGYDEYIKGLVSVFASQAQEIKKLGVKYDEAELQIMKNVRAQAASVVLVQLSKVTIDDIKQRASQSKEQNIMSRSVSMAQEKQQAQFHEKEVMKQEVETLGQRNKYLQTQNDSMLSELTALRSERKNLLTKIQIQESEYKTMKDQHDQILEDLQALKLEKMKRDVQEQPQVQNEQLESKIKELNDQVVRLSNDSLQFKLQLDEERKLKVQASEQVEQSKKQVQQLKSQVGELEHRVIEKDSSILKLKQDIEILNLQTSQSEGNQAQGETQAIIAQKNEQISLLTTKLNESSQKLQRLEDDLKRANALNADLDRNRADNVREIQQLERELMRLRQVEAKPVTQDLKSSSGSVGVNMSIILKDLEDGKHLMEKKNAEIIGLKKTVKEQEEQIQQLTQQIRSSKTEMAKYEQENKDFYVIMRRASQENNESNVLEADLDLLLRDTDPAKRTAARNIKNKIDAMEREVMFRQTEAEIKREQLEPFKAKAKTLETQNNEMNSLNRDLENRVHQQEDLIKEQERQLDLLREKLQANQASIQNQMVKPRTNVGNDKNVLNENRSCTGEQPCKLF